MRTHTRLARSPHALRRNRMILAAMLAATPLLGASLWLTSAPAAGPLLLSLDEMSTRRDRELLPVAAAQPVAMSPLQSSLFGEVPPSINALESSDIDREIDAEAQTEEEVRWFNGRPVRPVRTMMMVVTAYSPDERSCGESADGITASGLSVWTNNMKLAAADTSLLPFGSMISVPGYDDGRVIPVLDRGGAITGNRLDLLYPTHEQALQWGVQPMEVTVWEYADGLPNDFVPRYNAN